MDAAMATTRGADKYKILILLALMAIYALCFVSIKAGLVYAPPLRFAGLRALIGGAALLGLLGARRERLIPARTRWRGILALALIATTITFAAMFLSPGRTGAGIASVLGNTQPLFTIVLAAFFLGERITSGKLLALFVGLSGVTLIAYPALVTLDTYGISGAALALTAALSAAAGNVLAKRMNLGDDLIAVTGWQLVLGSIPLFALSLWGERDAKISWNVEFIGLLLFLALAGTALLTAAWYWLIQSEPVGRLTLFFFLVPALGLGIAALVFGERVSWVEGIGAGLTVLAGGITAWEMTSHAPNLAARQNVV